MSIKETIDSLSFRWGKKSSKMGFRAEMAAGEVGYLFWR